MSTQRDGQQSSNDSPPPDDLNVEDDQSLASERRIPSVNRVRSLQSRVTTVLTISVMSTLAFALLAWYYTRALSHDEAAGSNRAKRRAANTADTFLPALTGIPEPPLPPEIATVAEQAPRTDDSRSFSRRSRSEGKTPVARQLTAPVYRRLSATSSSSSQPGAFRSNVITDVPGGAGSLSTDTSNDLSSMLRSPRRQNTTAYALPAPHFTLRQGFHIDCTLETAITSSLPGATRCVTATDTWSADGSVVLLERGTTIFGETQGLATEGNHRLFILWTHAYTPNHIVVPLDAPGTDALGRSGVTGDVNYHFFQRFGTAMLISVIDGVAQSASNSRTGDDSIVINTNPSRDLVLEVLRNTSKIRPTVEVHQGGHVQVGVPRNVDFRAVYELARIHNR
jgi:type IV secretion system protein VirB10